MPTDAVAAPVRWGPTSLDPKRIGLRYGLTGAAFLFLGFLLMVLMRWQLAYPGEALPLGTWLGESRAPQGVLAPEFYNQLGAMHGTIMIFLAVVPMLIGGFGNYLVPLMIGAPQVAFPRLNALSYWSYLLGGIVMLAGFVTPGGAAASGWTSYPPLAIVEISGQTLWLVGMVFVSISSTLGAVNMLVTIIQLRCPGMTLGRLPFFVWGQMVSAFLLLLAFPPLQAAAVLQLMDRVAGSSFFLPSGLVVSGEIVEISGGGSPLLWQHLFWFLAHPEVYVLILPALGIVTEVITTHGRVALWGRRWAVGSVLAIGVLAFLVWAHHMFLTGMGTVISGFFQATTMIISIPSVVILSCLFLSLWGSRLRYRSATLFALAFLPMFGIGGLTGLPLGMAIANLQLHDTYYVLGHFHYVVAPGTLFAIFAGIYHWFPKITGRRLSERLGKLHFWPTLVLMNGIFFPMFIVGLAGVSRRLYDGGAGYAFARDVTSLQELMSFCAWALGIAQVPFLLNLALSLKRPATNTADPWSGCTLEWATASPPLPLNFPSEPRVVRAPYLFVREPNQTEDVEPQWSRHGSDGPAAELAETLRPENGATPTSLRWISSPRPDTGVTNGALALWLFLAAEVMFFGSLLSSYVLLRLGNGERWAVEGLDLGAGPGAWKAAVLVASSVALLLAVRRARVGRSVRALGATTLLLGATFLGARASELAGLASAGLVPRSGVATAMFYTVSGLQGLHLLAVAIVLLVAMVKKGGDRGSANRIPDTRPLRLVSIAWHFFVAVWLVFFTLFHLT